MEAILIASLITTIAAVGAAFISGFFYYAKRNSYQNGSVATAANNMTTALEAMNHIHDDYIRRVEQIQRQGCAEHQAILSTLENLANILAPRTPKVTRTRKKRDA